MKEIAVYIINIETNIVKVLEPYFDLLDVPLKNAIWWLFLFKN
jgi:hypothetical protein